MVDTACSAVIKRTRVRSKRNAGDLPVILFAADAPLAAISDRWGHERIGLLIVCYLPDINAGDLAVVFGPRMIHKTCLFSTDQRGRTNLGLHLKFLLQLYVVNVYYCSITSLYTMPSCQSRMGNCQIGTRKLEVAAPWFTMELTQSMSTCEWRQAAWRGNLDPGGLAYFDQHHKLTHYSTWSCRSADADLVFNMVLYVQV